MTRPYSRRRFLGQSLGLGAATVAGSALWTGCGSGSDQQGDDEQGVVVSKPVEGKLNVTWWTHNNPAFVAANVEMIRRFEEENPDVHIVYQHFPYDVFSRKLQAGYRAENVADIQQMFGTWVTEYAKNGLLDEVPASLGGSKAAESFWPAAVGAYQYKDKLYGIPHEYNLENGGLLFNPRLAKASGITEPPSTWEELVEAGQRLTKRNPKGKVTQVGLAFTASDPITFTFLSMILQRGGDYWDADGVHVNFHSSQAQQAWIDETELVTRYQVDNSTWYNGDPFEMFFRGRAAMAKHGPWVVEAGKANFPKFTDLTYIAEPPYAGDVVKFAAESGWGEVVNAGASDENREAAWKFIEFMAQTDNMRDWNARTATVPALRELKDDPQLLQKAPYLEVPFAVLPHGRWVGQVYDRDAFWGFINDAFVSVELGKADPIDALQEAEQQINAMIDQNVEPR
ncbi:MAG TPA: ABC transporter substrate-binding protein [Actinopolymorphaceae bacterium]